MENTTWDDLRVLLALHRHHSFLAAGKALGLSTSTAARRIEALERSLGRPVVQRSSSGTTVEALNISQSVFMDGDLFPPSASKLAYLVQQEIQVG